MAVNDVRSMIGDLHQGIIDNTYMDLTPDRGNVENPPYPRMDWPTFRQVERHQDPPFIEAHVRRIPLVRERRIGDQDFAGDPRY